MILLVFVASILVSILLERQARQHEHERAIEYERLGLPIPPRRPKLKRAEAWMNVGLGLILVALSLMSVSSGFLMRSMADKFPDHAAELANDFSQAIQNAAFFLASGMALIWLGWKAVREITLYESLAAGVPPIPGTMPGVSAGSPPVHRSMRLNLTAAIAAGAFCAGILTGYLLLSRESPSAATAAPDQATVSLEIQAGTDAELPPGFADELGRRFEAELGSLPGVRVVRTPEAAYLFRARLGREDGSIVISWNVVRKRDNAPWYNRVFTIPVNAPANPLQVMITSVSSSFGEKRTTAEFERILQLPENSLD